MYRETSEVIYDAQDIADNKLVASISYFYCLFFVPLLICPRSSFARFHANQALILFLVSTIGGAVLRFIPILGGFAAWIFGLFVLFFGVSGFLNAYGGKARELPFVGHLRLIK